MPAHFSFQSCLSFAVVLLGGCSSSPTEPAFVPIGSVLLVSPPTARIGDRGTLQLTVNVAGSNQSLTLSPELVWSSSDEQVAGVRSDGVVFGRAGGTADIVARWNGLRGVARITVVATSIPELKPPKRCTPLAISSAEQGVNATTAIPTCGER
jgi:hypothetical protein